MQKLSNQWAELLNDEFKKPYFSNLMTQLEIEYDTHTIYPPQEDIFNAFNLTDYPIVKVVIIGQDPYHGEGQAHGLSFSVLPGIKPPPSLVNIYKELQSDLNCTMPNNGYLLKWAQQGVLLLNTTLTVRSGNPNSHERIGWSTFTARVIELLNSHETPIVYLLWGKHAQHYTQLIDQSKHLILEAPHPSPLSAHRGFFGCRHFSKANEFLMAHNLQPIDWQIENLPE